MHVWGLQGCIYGRVVRKVRGDMICMRGIEVVSMHERIVRYRLRTCLLYFRQRHVLFFFMCIIMHTRLLGCMCVRSCARNVESGYACVESA